MTQNWWAGEKAFMEEKNNSISRRSFWKNHIRIFVTEINEPGELPKIRMVKSKPSFQYCNKWRIGY